MNINIIKSIAGSVANKLHCDKYGSCLNFAEDFVLAIKERHPEFIKNIEVVEGYVDIGDDILQHTWIETDGEKIDPTFVQFLRYSNSPEYYHKEKKRYSGDEYLDIIANDPMGDTYQKFYKEVRSIIREAVLFSENIQLADKVYFKTGELTPEHKEVILKVTGGDPYTKVISDIAFQNKKYETIKTLEPIFQRAYEQLKAYNKNVFPIKGFDINDNSDFSIGKSILNVRESAIKKLNSLPSVAKRNLKADIRIERDFNGIYKYNDRLEYLISHLSYLNNRDETLKTKLQNKIFRSSTNLEDMIEFIEDKEALIGGEEFTKETIKDLVEQPHMAAEIIREKGDIMVVEVWDPNSIKALGCNSLWCFTYGREFGNAYHDWNEYSHNDIVYVIIDFSEPSDSQDFMHVYVKPIDYQETNDTNEFVFNMMNDGIYDPVGFLDHTVGKDWPTLLNFDEEEELEGAA